MTTALDLIEGALEFIGYKGSEIPVEADDVSIGLDELNDMLSEWDGSGIKLGASPVDKPADTVRIPRWAVSAVKKNLGGRLASPFKRPLTVEMSAAIKSSTKNMLRALVKPIEVEFPGTLPIGAGNECSDVNWDARFFTQNEKENF